MTRPIELVTLDMAGTTVEEGGAVYRALTDAVSNAGGTPSEHDIGRWMGAGKREAIQALLTDALGPISDRQVDDAFADFRRRLDRAYRETPPTPIDGVLETLRGLREQGIRVALTTGFDREVTDSLIDTLGWRRDVVDAMVCVDDVSAGRPAPYLIFHAMESLGVTDVRAVLVAGDTPRDIQAGHNAGAALVIGVLTGGVPAEDLEAERPHRVLADLTGIPALIDEAAAT